MDPAHLLPEESVYESMTAVPRAPCRFTLSARRAVKVSVSASYRFSASGRPIVPTQRVPEVSSVSEAMKLSLMVRGLAGSCRKTVTL